MGLQTTKPFNILIAHSGKRMYMCHGGDAFILGNVDFYLCNHHKAACIQTYTYLTYTPRFYVHVYAAHSIAYFS